MSDGNKISYILEVSDGYSETIKKFNDSLNSAGKSTKKFTEQEEKTRKARINYSKIQQEEWRQHKQWMHDERIGLSKTLFLKSNIAKTTKASALAEKDNAIAGAINLRTLSQKQLLNKQAVNDLSKIRIQEQFILDNRIKAARMNVSSAMLAPSGAFTKVGFNNQLGKFESIEKAQANNSAYKGSTRPIIAGAYSKIRFDNEEGRWVSANQNKVIGYGAAGLLGGRLNAGSIASGLGFAGAAYTVGRSVKYVHDTTVQMDSLRASLSALIPNVKGLAGVATPESEIKYLRGVADKYGLSFSDIAPSYVKILGTGGKTDSSLARGLIENIGGYSGLLGLSGSATQDTMRGFQDMLTKQVLNAQEVKLQMQQLPGIQPMFHEAFYNIAKRQYEAKGKKSPITMENASAEFMRSMATGTLSSDLILREVIKVIEKKFGKEMLQKAYKLGNEERRLASATQELATSFGDLTYELQIGTVRGLTGFTKGVNSFIDDLQSSRDILGDFFNKNKTEDKVWLDKLRQENPNPYGLGLTGNIIGKGFTAANEVAKLPINTLYEGAMGAISGDWSGILKPMKEFNDYFGFTDVINSINSLASAILGQNQNKQQVEVKISAENLPNVFNVQTSQPNQSMWRPSTVIAGQR